MENNKDTEKPLKILYIYRHPDMGYSIGRVFKPIEEEMRKYAEVDSLYLPVPNYSLNGLWRNIKAARVAVKQKHYDIVHITGTEHYLVPFLSGQRVVLTVHDLGFYTNHKGSVRSIWKYFVWILSLKFADFITFISEKSKNEAKSLLNLNDERLKIIPNAVGTDFIYSSKQIEQNSPIILQIGTKPNKNLLNVIQAIKNLPYKLRIIGKLSNSQKKMLEDNNIIYSSAENLSDGQIIEEYKKCDIVSLPSLYEGFGMPIIEGQAIGRPVLTSNLSPMKEISGEAAVLVDPTDIDSIRLGFQIAIQNWSDIVEKGLNNVHRFSVDKISRMYFLLYKDLIA